MAKIIWVPSFRHDSLFGGSLCPFSWVYQGLGCWCSDSSSVAVLQRTYMSHTVCVILSELAKRKQTLMSTTSAPWKRGMTVMVCICLGRTTNTSLEVICRKGLNRGVFRQDTRGVISPIPYVLYIKFREQKLYCLGKKRQKIVQALHTYLLEEWWLIAVCFPGIRRSRETGHHRC